MSDFSDLISSVSKFSDPIKNAIRSKKIEEKNKENKPPQKVCIQIPKPFSKFSKLKKQTKKGPPIVPKNAIRSKIIEINNKIAFLLL